MPKPSSSRTVGVAENAAAQTPRKKEKARFAARLL